MSIQPLVQNAYKLCDFAQIDLLRNRCGLSSFSPSIDTPSKQNITAIGNTQHCI